MIGDRGASECFYVFLLWLSQIVTTAKSQRAAICKFRYDKRGIGYQPAGDTRHSRVPESNEDSVCFAKATQAKQQCVLTVLPWWLRSHLPQFCEQINIDLFEELAKSRLHWMKKWIAGEESLSFWVGLDVNLACCCLQVCQSMLSFRPLHPSYPKLLFGFVQFLKRRSSALPWHPGCKSFIVTYRVNMHVYAYICLQDLTGDRFILSYVLRIVFALIVHSTCDLTFVGQRDSRTRSLAYENLGGAGHTGHLNCANGMRESQRSYDTRAKHGKTHMKFTILLGRFDPMKLWQAT